MTDPRNLVKSPGVASVDEVAKITYENAIDELRGPSPIWDVAHGSGITELRPEDVRCLRGRVIVDVLPDVVSDVLVIPNGEDRGRTIGPAVVLGMGPPALSKRGVEIPWDFRIGDTVMVTLPHKSRAMVMNGRSVNWVAQNEVHGVVEP